MVPTGYRRAESNRSVICCSCAVQHEPGLACAAVGLRLVDTGLQQIKSPRQVLPWILYCALPSFVPFFKRGIALCLCGFVSPHVCVVPVSIRIQVTVKVDTGNGKLIMNQRLPIPVLRQSLLQHLHCNMRHGIRLEAL